MLSLAPAQNVQVSQTNYATASERLAKAREDNETLQSQQNEVGACRCELLAVRHDGSLALCRRPPSNNGKSMRCSSRSVDDCILALFSST